MGIGVESTQLLEVALELGRSTELFLANGALAAEVRGRMEKAFQKAFMSGMFKVNPKKPNTTCGYRDLQWPRLPAV